MANYTTHSSINKLSYKFAPEHRPWANNLLLWITGTITISWLIDFSNIFSIRIVPLGTIIPNVLFLPSILLIIPRNPFLIWEGRTRLQKLLLFFYSVNLLEIFGLGIYEWVGHSMMVPWENIWLANRMIELLVILICFWLSKRVHRIPSHIYIFFGFLVGNCVSILFLLNQRKWGSFFLAVMIAIIAVLLIFESFHRKILYRSILFHYLVTVAGLLAFIPLIFSVNRLNGITIWIFFGWVRILILWGLFAWWYRQSAYFQNRLKLAKRQIWQTNQRIALIQREKSILEEKATKFHLSNSNIESWRQIVDQLLIPCGICNRTGKIEWMNKLFAEVSTSRTTQIVSNMEEIFIWEPSFSEIVSQIQSEPWIGNLITRKEKIQFFAYLCPIVSTPVSGNSGFVLFILPENVKSLFILKQEPFLSYMVSFIPSLFIVHIPTQKLYFSSPFTSLSEELCQFIIQEFCTYPIEKRLLPRVLSFRETEHMIFWPLFEEEQKLYFVLVKIEDLPLTQYLSCFQFLRQLIQNPGIDRTLDRLSWVQKSIKAIQDLFHCQQVYLVQRQGVNQYKLLFSAASYPGQKWEKELSSAHFSNMIDHSPSHKVIFFSPPSLSHSDPSEKNAFIVFGNHQHVQWILLLYQIPKDKQDPIFSTMLEVYVVFLIQNLPFYTTGEKSNFSFLSLGRKGEILRPVYPEFYVYPPISQLSKGELISSVLPLSIGSSLEKIWQVSSPQGMIVPVEFSFQGQIVFMVLTYHPGEEKWEGILVSGRKLFPIEENPVLSKQDRELDPTLALLFAYVQFHHQYVPTFFQDCLIHFSSCYSKLWILAQAILFRLIQLSSTSDSKDCWEIEPTLHQVFSLLHEWLGAEIKLPTLLLDPTCTTTYQGNREKVTWVLVFALSWELFLHKNRIPYILLKSLPFTDNPEELVQLELIIPVEGSLPQNQEQSKYNLLIQKVLDCLQIRRVEESFISPIILNQQECSSIIYRFPPSPSSQESLFSVPPKESRFELGIIAVSSPDLRYLCGQVTEYLCVNKRYLDNLHDILMSEDLFPGLPKLLLIEEKDYIHELKSFLNNLTQVKDLASFHIFLLSMGENFSGAWHKETIPLPFTTIDPPFSWSRLYTKILSEQYGNFSWERDNSNIYRLLINQHIIIQLRDPLLARQLASDFSFLGATCYLSNKERENIPFLNKVPSTVVTLVRDYQSEEALNSYVKPTSHRLLPPLIYIMTPSDQVLEGKALLRAPSTILYPSSFSTFVKNILKIIQQYSFSVDLIPPADSFMMSSDRSGFTIPPKMVSHLRTIFYQSLPNQLYRLEQAIIQKDLGQAYAILYYLQRMVKKLEWGEFSQLLEELLKWVQQENWSEGRRVLEQLKKVK